MSRNLHFQFVFSGITLILFTYLFFKFPFSLGGSITLMLIIATTVPLTFSMKNLANEFYIIQFIVAGIMGLNFLSYWEVATLKINVIYLIIFYSLLIWIILWYLVLTQRVLKNKDQLNESDQKLIKKINQTLTAPILFLGLQFSFFSGLMIFFIYKKEPQIYAKLYLKLSYVAIGWLIFFFFISLIYLKKISAENIKRLLANVEKQYYLEKYDKRMIKKYLISILSFIFVVGSMIELQRGMWFMWIETILLLGLMSLIIWKIYKHAFYAEEGKVKKE